LVQSVDATPVMFTLATMKINYSTDHFHGIIYDGGILGNILDPNGVTVDTPENAEQKREPRKEDIFFANRLISHFNCNLEYYNRMLWYSLDTNRRWLLLDGFTIQTYFQDGMPEKPHSLASSSRTTSSLLQAILLSFQSLPASIPASSDCTQQYRWRAAY
jgi:hypothetical protein